MRIDLYEQSGRQHVVYGEFEGVFVDESTGSVAPAIIMDKRGKQGKKVLTLFDCTMLAISGREIVYHPRTFWKFMAPGLRASFEEDWPSRKLWLQKGGDALLPRTYHHNHRGHNAAPTSNPKGAAR